MTKRGRQLVVWMVAATLGSLVEPLMAVVGEANAGTPPPTRSQVFGTSEYEVWLEHAGVVRANAPSTASAVLVPKAPFKCNLEYPSRFVPEDASGVTYSKDTPTLQLAADRCELSVGFSAANSGPARLTGTFKFSVCTPERCLVRKQPLTLEVRVAP
jgi:hypothetical protein